MFPVRHLVLYDDAALRLHRRLHVERRPLAFRRAHEARFGSASCFSFSSAAATALGLITISSCGVGRFHLVQTARIGKRVRSRVAAIGISG